VRFIVDENISPVVGDALQQNSHDVIAATVVCPGQSDRHVVSLAQAEARVVISEDKDFGELAFRDGLFPIGLIRIALPGSTPSEKAMRLLEVLALESDRIVGIVLVVEPSRVRTRPLQVHRSAGNP
jgi:predicted nuclease of predicted toxin-antitoxin system